MTAFRIDVPQEQLDDLQIRLDRVRWPDAVADGDDWSWGTPPATMRVLMDRWRDGYDWRATERRLNAAEQHLVEVDGCGIHAVRAGTPGATPLLLLHGWPDSILRFEKALPLLADRFDIVVPSLPGYGFSQRPAVPGTGPARVAELLTGLMDGFGFTRFGVHGADIGSTIAEAIARNAPGRVIGLHLGDVPPWRRAGVDPDTLSAEETAYFAEVAEWFGTEAAYLILQRTKPQTLAYGLTDSPVALAAWFVEKFRGWSDCDGDVFTRFTPDELIDNLMVYWVTGTAGSAARYYREAAAGPGGDPRVRLAVPTGFASFPFDMIRAPRGYAERFYDVRRWTEPARGGHFGPWEEPELFAAEVRAFFDEV